MGLEVVYSLPIACHPRNGWEKKKSLVIYKNGILLIRGIFLPV